MQPGKDRQGICRLQEKRREGKFGGSSEKCTHFAGFLLLVFQKNFVILHLFYPVEIINKYESLSLAKSFSW